MSAESEQRRPRQGEGVLSREAGGRTVLLVLADGSYYALDGTGVRIWELCDGNRTAGEIAEQLTAEFDAPLETVTADVEAFLAALQRDDLIRF